MTTVTMPQLGETVVEGTITKWLKKEGDHVDQDEPLFEISTDKVDTEVPSPAAGTLTKILVQEGQTVSVKTPIAEIDGAGAGGEDRAGAGAEPGPALPSGSDSPAEAVGVEAGSRAESGGVAVPAASPLAASAPSISAIGVFTDTVCPSCTRILLSVPAAGDGTSVSTLSVEISKSGSS
jgi:pyruvate dehydrogenase E2 component (dihydrolipoamide acetyltransferase)